MSDFAQMAESFQALANAAAYKLAQDAGTNVELRQALETVRLKQNEVRIGNFDILVTDNGDFRTYAIRCKHTGEIVVLDLPFYETARRVVNRLNEGQAPQSGSIMQVIQYGQQYMRACSDIEMHKQRVNEYVERRNEVKINLHEDRLDAAETRARLLRHKLLSPIY